MIQSDIAKCYKCYFFDQVNTSYSFEDTMYFVRTESLPFDPVVLPNYEEGRNDAFIIIDEVNTVDVVDIKDIKIEITSTSMVTDFLMDQLDNGNEQNKEETLFHYEPIDYSVDGNEQNKENQLQSATSNPTVPNEFDHVNPLADILFQFLLVVPTKYEVMNHLKRVS